MWNPTIMAGACSHAPWKKSHTQPARGPLLLHQRTNRCKSCFKPPIHGTIRLTHLLVRCALLPPSRTLLDSCSVGRRHARRGGLCLHWPQDGQSPAELRHGCRRRGQHHPPLHDGRPQDCHLPADVPPASCRAETRARGTRTSHRTSATRVELVHSDPWRVVATAKSCPLAATGTVRS